MKPLRKFAKDSGVTVELNGPGWGGRYGYRTELTPNCMECGFKTKDDALMHWAETTFGKKTTQALLKLLNQGNNNGN